MIFLRTVLLLLALGSLTSCSLWSPSVEEAKPAAGPSAEDMARLGMGFEDTLGAMQSSLMPGVAVDPNAQSYNVSSSEELEKIDNEAEGEVYFTDPDNPDADIAGITAAFEAKLNGNGWLDDYSRATRLAHRECRPLIIWFHDSVAAPKSNLLGEELLDTPEFNAWCRDRVVRLKLDAGASIDDRSGTRAKYSRERILNMAQRYGLTHRPALAVLSCRGKFVLGVDGYNEFTQQVESLLKEGVVKAEKEMNERREELIPKGYRTWCSATAEVTLFARLQRYDEENQMVYLKEYGGKISKIKLFRFCKEDREFVLKKQEEKKEKRRKKRERSAA